jgi:DNA-binding transcriptional regulator GbsR (MarR family)
MSFNPLAKKCRKPVGIAPELQEVAKEIGEFIEYWGFKNVHGRIWTHLFLSNKPLDAGDLIDRLKVSKALVSMSIAELTEYDVIRIAGKGEHGTVTYESNPDIMTVISNVLRKRERRLLGRISSSIRILRELKDVSPNPRSESCELSCPRIETLAEMVHTAEKALDGMLLMSDVSFDCWRQYDDLDKK